MKIIWKQVIVTFAISFVLGAFVGRWQAQYFRSHRKWGSENRSQWILKKMDRKLHFNKEQKQKVEAIFKEAEPQMKAIRSEMWPKFDGIRKQMNAKIRPLLDEKQQKKFEEMEMEWQEKMKQFGASASK